MSREGLTRQRLRISNPAFLESLFSGGEATHRTSAEEMLPLRAQREYLQGGPQARRSWRS